MWFFFHIYVRLRSDSSNAPEKPWIKDDHNLSEFVRYGIPALEFLSALLQSALQRSIGVYLIASDISIIIKEGLIQKPVDLMLRWHIYVKISDQSNII